MKKALFLILALVMCLSLCACGSGSGTSENPQNKGTPLTIDNYENYLNVSVSAHASKDDTHLPVSVKKHNNGKGMELPNGYAWELYPLLYVNTSVNGASTNFNYMDVELTIKVSGEYYPGAPSAGVWGDSTHFERNIIIKCDIGGKAFDNQYIDMGAYIHSDMMEYTWEVVSISGYVDKA